jgi:mono/diheme cytochrome c family protein
MKKTLLGATAGLIAVGLMAGGPRTASATIDMQKKAKAAGVEVQNCLHCHGEKLPKKGASTLNDKGKWLVAEKEKRQAKEVDAAWLKEYVEPKK